MRRIGTVCPKCTGSMILESDRLTKLVDKVCLNCGFTVHDKYEVIVVTGGRVGRTTSHGG